MFESLPPRDLNPAFDIQSVACFLYTRGHGGRPRVPEPPRRFRLIFMRTFVRMKARFDWDAIRAYYERGRSIRECQAEFGFSNGAWYAAVGRGDVDPREDTRREQAHTTREAVRLLLESGLNQTTVAFELRLSKGTVCYHAKNLGITGDRRYGQRYPWAEIQRAHDSGMSMRECQNVYGFSTSSWQEARRRGALEAKAAGVPIEQLLVANRPRSRGHIRARILRAGLKEERCERCGRDEWLDEPLRVTLHHVNGDPYDNRLENLKFLCPNCHSQTSNFSGRNGRLRNRG